MLAMNLNDIIQDKVSQLAKGTAVFQANQGIAQNFPDAPWTPGHHGRPLRMIAYDDMAAED